MGDCGELRSMSRAYVDSRDHIRQSCHWWNVEPVANYFDRNGACKGPESLSFLNHRVNSVTHLGIRRIRKNAAIPKCARTEFHPSLIPRDYVTLFNQPRCATTTLFRAPEPCRLNSIVKSLEGILDFTKRTGWSEK